MAHCGRGRLPPPSRATWQGLCALSTLNGTLECPPQEDPDPYRDLSGVFRKHLWGALFPPWIIGHNSMTVWEAHIVGAELVREWSRSCATMRAPGTPAPQYAAVPLEGWAPHTRLRPTTIRAAGPEHPWDAAATEWLRAAPEPHTGWSGVVSSLLRLGGSSCTVKICPNLPVCTTQKKRLFWAPENKET